MCLSETPVSLSRAKKPWGLVKAHGEVSSGLRGSGSALIMQPTGAAVKIERDRTQ